MKTQMVQIMNDGIRLNKYISSCGFCSRRKADEWIQAGRVCVNGAVADIGMKVTQKDAVTVNGQPVRQTGKFKLVAFYKPKGYTVTFYPGDESNIFHNFSFDEDLRYIGRLDKDSEGLLLLTNDGNLCNEISKARNEHEKEYMVTVNRDLSEDFLEGMGSGVRIFDEKKNRYVVTKPCKVTRMGKRSFSIVLTQGYNRQIRRMCEHFDYRVTRLLRTRVMNIELGDMHPGDIRKATDVEITGLKKLCNGENK